MRSGRACHRQLPTPVLSVYGSGMLICRPIKDGLQEINERCLLFERARHFWRQFVRLSIGNGRKARSPSLMMRHFVDVVVTEPAHVMASSSQFLAHRRSSLSFKFSSANIRVYMISHYIACMYLSRAFQPTPMILGLGLGLGSSTDAKISIYQRNMFSSCS